MEENVLLENKRTDITFYKGEWTNDITSCNDEMAEMGHLFISYEESTKKYIISGLEWSGNIIKYQNDEFSISGYTEGEEFNVSYKFYFDKGSLKFKFLKGDWDVLGTENYFKCK